MDNISDLAPAPPCDKDSSIAVQDATSQTDKSSYPIAFPITAVHIITESSTNVDSHYDNVSASGGNDSRRMLTQCAYCHGDVLVTRYSLRYVCPHCSKEQAEGLGFGRVCWICVIN